MSDAPELLLANHLKTLRLPTFLREHDKLAHICAAEGVGHVRYLARLTELELIDRERRMVERRTKLAKFPAVKSLDSFDFKAIPSLNKMMVLELTRCNWIERRENVIALGPSGTGKTHVSGQAIEARHCLDRTGSEQTTHLFYGINPLGRSGTSPVYDLPDAVAVFGQISCEDRFVMRDPVPKSADTFYVPIHLNPCFCQC